MPNDKAMLAMVDTYTDEEFIDSVVNDLSRLQAIDLAEVSESFALGAIVANLEILEAKVRAYRKKKFGDKPIVTL